MATTTRKISRPLSKEEGFRYIEDYLRSGMRGSEYYRAHGLSEWQFYKWKQLYLLEHPEASETVMKKTGGHNGSLMRPVEVKHVPGDETPCMPPIDIYYPGGIHLRVEGGLRDVSLLERLLNR